MATLGLSMRKKPHVIERGDQSIEGGPREGIRHLSNSKRRQENHFHICPEKSNVKTVKRYRNIEIGTVFEIPIDDRYYAYICAITSVNYWLYDFITDWTTGSKSYFGCENWKLPFVLMKGVSDELKRVAIIDLTEEQRRVPLTWERISDAQVIDDDLPSPYRVFCNERGDFYVPEAETRNMFPKRIADPDHLAAFIEQFLPNLRRVEIKEDEVAERTLAAPQPVKSDTGGDLVTIEIRATPECQVHRDDVEDELDEALQKAGVGDMIGAGGGELGNWDLAVKTMESDLKRTLRIIKKVLKRMKMPNDTTLVEQRADLEDVEHDLN
jgi:hypothetical protein